MAKKSKDIFDLSDVSDLPKELRPKVISKPDIKTRYIKLIEGAGRPLTFQEICAGVYRTGIGTATRPAVSNMLARLVHDGLIQKMGNNEYAAKPE